MTDKIKADANDAVAINPRSFQSVMIGGVPCLMMYDSTKDETTVIDRDHHFYVNAMAAFSIIEMAFAPVLQEKPKKKTILQVERPKLIRGLHS